MCRLAFFSFYIRKKAFTHTIFIRYLVFAGPLIRFEETTCVRFTVAQIFFGWKTYTHTRSHARKPNTYSTHTCIAKTSFVRVTWNELIVIHRLKSLLCISYCGIRLFLEFELSWTECVVSRQAIISCAFVCDVAYVFVWMWEVCSKAIYCVVLQTSSSSTVSLARKKHYSFLFNTIFIVDVRRERD